MPTIYKRKNGSTRGNWDQENMFDAIDSVRKKEMGIRKACRFYNVPYQTLRVRLNDSPRQNRGLGPTSCFGPENEKKLAAHLKTLCNSGFPCDRQKVRQIAFQYAENLNINHKFNRETQMAGRDWLKSFMRRNPDLSIRKSEGLSMNRALGLSRTAVQKFYDLLENEIKVHSLQNKPQNLFNCDESGLQLINTTGQVIAAKGSKVVNQITTGERGETITLLACCSAEGRFLPPVLVFKGKNLKPEFEDGLTPGSKVYMNVKSAYINSTLFLRWFKEHFLPRKAPGRNILILDGHCSHSGSIELLDCAEENGVTLLCLPPHTTHALQPLDKAFFGPLKSHFKVETNTWVNQHIGRKLTRYQVGPLVTLAWKKAATVGNATNGFSSTGIYPFNRNIIPDHMFVVSDQATVQPNEKEQEMREEILNENPEIISDDDESSPTDRNAKSPTKILSKISPVPALSRARSTRKFEPVLLTSIVNREKVREKEKKNQEKAKKKEEPGKTKATSTRKRLRNDETENEDLSSEISDEDYNPKRKQHTKKSSKKKGKKQATNETVTPRRKQPTRNVTEKKTLPKKQLRQQPELINCFI